MKRHLWVTASLMLMMLFSLTGSARAADFVVTPATPNGWIFAVETGTATGEYVTGPGTPPAGVGSFQFGLVDFSSGAVFGTAQYAGVRLDELTTLSYSTYNTTGNNSVAPSLQINIDYDLTDSSTAWQGRLVFEPSNSGTVVDGTWQTWDALAGSWWSSGTPIVGDVAGTPSCLIFAPCDLATILATFPNAGVQVGNLSGVLFKAGGGWFFGYEGSVDNFAIGVNGVVDTFNFEPPRPQLAITKTGPATAITGDTYSYTVTVENIGSANATGVVLTDSLPAGVVSVGNTQGCTGVITVTCNVGTLAPAASYTVTITVQSNVAAGDTVTNVAIVDSVETAAVSSAPVNTTFEAAPVTAELSVTLVGPQSVTTGDTFNYTATITNIGGTEATGVVLAANIPPEVTYISDDQLCGATVTCNVGTLAPAANYTVNITVQATGAPGTTAISQVSGNSNETAVANSNVLNTAIVAVPVEPEPVEPEPVVEVYTPPLATCDIMNPTTFAAGNIPDGTYCRIMMQDGRNMANDGAVPQELVDNGVILALEIYRLQGGQSVATFDTYAQFCIYGEGRLVYRDATNVPRHSVEMPVTMSDGYACTWIPNPGTLVLVSG